MGERTFSVSVQPAPRSLQDILGDNVVRINADPIERETETGVRISLGFPALYVSGWIAEPEAFAKRVAELLTEHQP